jgi:hypothetical protein
MPFYISAKMGELERRQDILSPFLYFKNLHPSPMLVLSPTTLLIPYVFITPET